MAGRGLNPTSWSFGQSIDLWKYLQVLTGFGNTTPPVYIPWKTPRRLHRRVISLIRTGANRFDRSFLCTTIKLTSEALRMFFRTRKETGIAEIKATSLRDALARIPTCHSLVQPGHSRALGLSVLDSFLGLSTYHLRNDIE